HSTAAPDMSREPATTTTAPKVPLWASRGLGGRRGTSVTVSGGCMAVSGGGPQWMLWEGRPGSKGRTLVRALASAAARPSPWPSPPPPRGRAAAGARRLPAAVPAARPLRAEPLPGTKPLEEKGDLALLMVEGMHKYLDRETAASVERRKERWKPDFSSVEA